MVTKLIVKFYGGRYKWIYWNRAFKLSLTAHIILPAIYLRYIIDDNNDYLNSL